MARSNTITVQRGTTHSIGITYKENGVAADITGSTILFTVKSVEYDSDASDSTNLIKKNVTAHSDPTNGVSSVVILPADTRSLAPGNYYYSVKIDKNSDDTLVYELDEGRFVLDADPTNRIAS